MPALQIPDDELVKLVLESFAQTTDADAPETLAKIAIDAGTAQLEHDLSGRTLTIGSDPGFFHGIPFDLDRLAEGVSRIASKVTTTGAEDEGGILVRISRKEIEVLDRFVNLMEVLAGSFETGFSDDAWNLRNRLVPYVPGDRHYDSEVHAD